MELGSPDVDAAAADMWSLGETTHQLLTKAPAFKTDNQFLSFIHGFESFPFHILKAHHVSDLGQNFILSVMNPSPGKRLTAEQALRHEWMKQLGPTKPAPALALE